jgi:hypothetical protein
MEDFREEVQKAARKRVLFVRHALDQMNRPERMISQKEVREVIFNGEIIEDYPEDVRGHSCLMCGLAQSSQRILHVVCAPKVDFLTVITAYIPSPDEWEANFKVRKR